MSAPIPSRQTARLVNGIHTEIIVQRFTDRILVLVTQLNKVGQLLQVSAPVHRSSLPPLLTRNATMPELQGLNLPAIEPSLSLTPLMGRAPNDHAQLLHHLYATQIASIVFEAASGTGNEPWQGNAVVVGIALKGAAGDSDEMEISPDERKTFAEVMKMVLECRVW
jgi:proteasome assembly chaperone 3